MSHIQCNQTDPWRTVEAERSSAGFPPWGEAVVRTAVSCLVDRASIQEHLVGRNGRITANFLNAPERFRSTATSWEFNIDRAGQLLSEAGWRRWSSP